MLAGAVGEETGDAVVPPHAGMISTMANRYPSTLEVFPARPAGADLVVSWLPAPGPARIQCRRAAVPLFTAVSYPGAILLLLCRLGGQCTEDAGSTLAPCPAARSVAGDSVEQAQA